MTSHMIDKTYVVRERESLYEVVKNILRETYGVDSSNCFSFLLTDEYLPQIQRIGNWLKGQEARYNKSMVEDYTDFEGIDVFEAQTEITLPGTLVVLLMEVDLLQELKPEEDNVLTHPEEKRVCLIVIGAEDLPTNDEKAGNRLMFMAQGLRFLREHKEKFDKIVIAFFRGTKKNYDSNLPHVDQSFDHTLDQLGAFKEAVEENGGEFKVFIDSIDIYQSGVPQKKSLQFFLEYLHSFLCSEEKIQSLIFFAHGDPGRIWLDDEPDSLYFNNDFVNDLHLGIFTKDRDAEYTRIVSYACQTGNGTKKGAPEQRRDASLAQYMADRLEMPVIASMTKTGYSKTWDGKLRGWWDERTGNRSIIDGGVWENDGADGPVYSVEDDPPNTPQGFFLFRKGESSIIINDFKLR